jgi:hypothetical protein
MSNDYTEAEIERSQAMIELVLGEPADPWKWWRDALEGRIDKANLNESNPQTGYYRIKQGSHFIPVAFWIDTKTGERRCQVYGKDCEGTRQLEVWVSASDNPVTGEAYAERMRTGKWPDESRSVGDNNPPGDTPEAMAERLDDLEREAAVLLKNGVINDDVCNQVSDHSNRFGELQKHCDALRLNEKAPHDQAAKAVDGKWRGGGGRAKALKERLKIAITPYMKKKDEEKRRRELEAATKGEPIPEIRNTAGTVKRSTALRTHHRALIEDKAKLIESLNDHPELLSCIQSIADAAARRKIALPGCKVISEQRAA